jgi:short-subunit dehydrogenase
VTYRTVITGASSGIGRATALLLSRDAHALVMNARRERELQSLAESCLAGGACSVAVVAGDITVADTAIELAESVARSGPGEVVLVNCAGAAEFGPFHEQDIEAAVGMVDVILCGAMRATHALLPAMLEQGRGTVINVLSIAARQDFRGSQAYCAAKAGLAAFSRTLSLDYRAQGIRVTSLLPGATDTPLWDEIEGHPAREDMLPAKAVAETIKYLIDLPRDRVVDEIVLTPPKGTL